MNVGNEGQRRHGARGAPRPDEGFALLTVVWAISLVSLCATIYMTAAQTRSKEAAAAAGHARANAAARAGMMLGISELVSVVLRNPAALSDDEQNGSGRCQLGGGDMVRWMATSESGRVDVNAASEELIHALMRVTAANDDDWRAASRALLRAREEMRILAGDDKSPAFRSIADLSRLPDLSHAQYERLRPFVTVHSGRPGLHPGKASPALLSRLGDRGSRGATPAYFLADVPGHVFRIVSEADVGGAVAQHRAIVEIDAEAPVSFAIREWRDGFEPVDRPFPELVVANCRALQPQ